MLLVLWATILSFAILIVFYSIMQIIINISRNNYRFIIKYAVILIVYLFIIDILIYQGKFLV